MKNIYDVMRQKEQEIDRLKKELQALYFVAPMLEEELPAETMPVLEERQASAS